MAILLYVLGGVALFTAGMIAAAGQDRASVQMATPLATCAAFFLTGGRLIQINELTARLLSAILDQLQKSAPPPADLSRIDSVSSVSFERPTEWPPRG